MTKIIYLCFSLFVVYLIKINKKYNLIWEQTGKKIWNRKIFEYLRKDNQITQHTHNDKIYFYKKNDHENKLCGLESDSCININTDFPELKEYCNDKTLFLYVISPQFTPLTLFFNRYGTKEKEKNFKKNDLSLTLKDKDLLDSQHYVVSNKLINTQGRIIKKPLVGSQGKGIEVIGDLQNCFVNKNVFELNKYLYQEEIKPKLLNGYKFDIRYFAVIIVKNNSIEIEHIPYAMIRLCSKKFSFDTNDLHSNLTNTSVNKDNKCTISICKDDEKWKKYFIDMEIITNDFFNNTIKEIGEKSFYRINDISIASTRIIGFDFIISQDDEMFILESNYSPGDNTYYGSECKKKVIEYYAENIIKKIL